MTVKRGHDRSASQRVRHQRLPGSSARHRLLAAVAVGVVTAVAAEPLLPWELTLLVGWDVVAGVLVAWNWVTIARLDAVETAEFAVVDDPTAAWTDLLLLCAAVASLAAVGLVLVGAAAGTGIGVGSRVWPAFPSVVLSWVLVHTIFTLRYARLYYGGQDGGVDFNQDEPPDYLDFAYVAFTVGMTFQVSDTALHSSAIRRTALRHALVSYVFGAVIVASTVNLIAGLVK